MEELLPNVEQRFCVRHLYNNFRKKHPGKQLKDLVWRAAKASYVAQWERVMQEMRAVNVAACGHMMKIPPRFWSKSRFQFNSKCDALLNNMSEAFNSVIVESRSKPIVTMLEEIREYLMERWDKNRKQIAAYDGTVLPKIKKRIESISAHTNVWLVRWGGEYLAEVRHINLLGDKFAINLESKECSCRRWMLCGLPCTHALAAMKSKDINIEDYIPDYYKRDVYAAVYQSVIYPVNGQNVWARTEYPDVQPPPIRKMPGRPKKKRNREAAELEEDGTKMTRRGFGIKCSRCKQSGHNKSTCKLPPPPSATTESVPAGTTESVPATTTESVPAGATEPVPAATIRRKKLPTRRAQPAPAVTAQPVPAASTQPVPVRQAQSQPTVSRKTRLRKPTMKAQTQPWK